MKRGKDVLERIIVQISRYLSEALAAEIARAQWHSDAPMWVNRLRRDIFDEDADGACFEVVARTAGGEAVGRLHCIRNRQDPTLWYYGDLFVVPAYRRSGIALLMLEEAKTICSKSAHGGSAAMWSRRTRPASGFRKKPAFWKSRLKTSITCRTKAGSCWNASFPSPSR